MKEMSRKYRLLALVSKYLIFVMLRGDSRELRVPQPHPVVS